MRNLSGLYNEILQTISQSDPRMSSETVQNSFEVEDVPEKKNVLEALHEQRPNVPSNQDYSVLKITGIHRDAAISDVYDFFDPIKIPHSHHPPYFSECVHMVSVGASSELVVFVEFPTKELAKEAYDLKSIQPVILKYDVRLKYSSQAELQRSLFPKKRVQKNKSEIEDGIIYMPGESIMSLVNACRSIKHYSSSPKPKLIHRPFQSVISVLTKVDWSRTKEISILQRDHLFEMVKLAIDATNVENWPPYTRKPKDIVEIKMRLLRAGLCVPLFTEKQKVILLTNAGTPCPKDLIMFVYTPESSENEFVKYSSPFQRERNTSGESMFGTAVSYSPPEFSPTMASYRNLRNRADQADQVISLLQKDVHEMNLKYQNTIFELDRVEERYRSLKREFENLETYCKALRRVERDSHTFQEPSPGFEMVRTSSAGPFDIATLKEHPSPSASYTSRRLQSFDKEARERQLSRYSLEDPGDLNDYTNDWCK